MTLIVLDGTVGIAVNDNLDVTELKIREAKESGEFARFLRTDQEDTLLLEVRVDPTRVTHLNATNAEAAATQGDQG